MGEVGAKIGCLVDQLSGIERAYIACVLVNAETAGLHMKYYLLAFLVGVLNVTLNELCKHAGAQMANGVMSREAVAWVLIAFACGCASFATLVTFYATTGEALVKGIVVLGATSMILGSLYALRKYGNILHPVEWLLLIAIGGFYLARAFRVFSS